jgi:predicted  nucleic acid-binding Zn-ribbon protein
VSAQHTRATLRIQARLERMELSHLREHAAYLQARLDAAEKRAADAEQRAWDAEGRAEMFHDLAHRLQDDMPLHRAIGVTRDGALLVVAQ